MSVFSSRTPEGLFNYLLAALLLLAAFFGVVFWLTATGAIQP
ncbi:MAG: hypothetical protein ABEJ22_02725 [Haloferacaceae archaeon]